MTTLPFTGFTFNGVHSSRFEVYFVSKSNRYTNTFSGKIKNNSLSVQGYEGEYFFGSNIGKKTFSLSCAVNRATEAQLRGIQHWLRPGTSGQLIIDGLEYKYTNVVLGKQLTFSFVPMNGDYDNNEYNGLFDLSFEAHDPYSYSTFYAVNNFQFTGEWDNTTSYIIGDKAFYQDVEYECNTVHSNQIPTNTSYWDYVGDAQPWYWDSGMLFENWAPDVTFDYTGSPVTVDTEYILYNGGNAAANPIITIDGSWNELTLTNEETGQTLTLTDDGGAYPVVIDCSLAQITIDGDLANSIHTGDFIEVLGSGLNTQVDVSATNGSVDVALGSGFSLQDDMLNRYMCFDGSAYKITDVSSADATEFTLDRVFEGTTGTHTVEIVDGNTITLTGDTFSIDSIDFLYKYVYY